MDLKLQFRQGRRTDHSLGIGVHRLVRGPDGLVGLGEATQGVLLAQICIDGRGTWLQVASGTRGGVHVNGRPVHRMAILRAGDSLHVDGTEMLLQGVARPVRDDTAGVRPEADAGDPRFVLRGVGGPHHGRSFPLLASFSEVGSAESVDIRIDSPGIRPRHARLQRFGSYVLLNGLGAESRLSVNGVETRDALLSSGDQVVFGSQSRFIVEIPWQANTEHAETEPGEDETGAGTAPPVQPRRSIKRWPWLLLAALLLALTLSMLLLFGRG